MTDTLGSTTFKLKQRTYIIAYEDSGNEHSPDWKSLIIETYSKQKAQEIFDNMNILYYDIFIHEIEKDM